MANRGVERLTANGDIIDAVNEDPLQHLVGDLSDAQLSEVVDRLEAYADDQQAIVNLTRALLDEALNFVFETGDATVEFNDALDECVRLSSLDEQAFPGDDDQDD